uniref:Uncharacterized protein n=1 Tax=Magallana gigas TaxID=29159 RepID=A0A8W8MJY3_MAGGI
MTCNEISAVFTTLRPLSVQISGTSCFSTLPWPTTQSPQSSSTQASTVGVKSTSHPTTVTTEKSAKTTDEHEEGISSTVTILIIISLCLSAIVLCGCLCLVLVRHIIRKRIQREHIENIESALSSYSVVDSESEL